MKQRNIAYIKKGMQK